MKKLLLILLCLPLMFSSCKKEEENLDSPSVGYWSGTYFSTGDVAGLFSVTISTNGDVNGSALNLGGMETNLNGTVTNNGDLTATSVEIGINFIGQLSNDTGSGIWNMDTNSETGTWELNKE